MSYCVTIIERSKKEKLANLEMDVIPQFRDYIDLKPKGLYQVHDRVITPLDGINSSKCAVICYVEKTTREL